MAIFERSFRFCDETRLWFGGGRGARDCSQRGFINSVLLSEGFYQELLTQSVPVDLVIIRQLMNSPGNLDFYLWLQVRSSRVRMGRFAKIPLFGPLGLASQLGVTGYDQDRDLRRQIAHWLSRTKEVWPSCPALLSKDRDYLFIWKLSNPPRQQPQAVSDGK
jgi:hypothetical protein